MRAATRKWAKRADVLKDLRRRDNMRTPVGTSSEEYVAKWKRPGKLIRAAL